MGLVDYSSGSESEAEAPNPATTSRDPSQSQPKKSFQKVVEQGKIRISLPSASASAPEDAPSEPPAKRIRTGTNAFANLNALLPPPKNTGAKPPAQVQRRGTAPRVGVNLRTGAAPAFTRDEDAGEGRDGGEAKEEEDGEGRKRKGDAVTGPEVAAGLKPEGEVTLVGKPLKFRPLSVARNPKKGGGKLAGKGKVIGAGLQEKPEAAREQKDGSQVVAPAKKISLFSIHADAPSATPNHGTDSGPGTYEPFFNPSVPDTESLVNSSPISNPPPPPDNPSLETGASLTTLADTLNLSATARRELFGRASSSNPTASATVISFNIDDEYRQNEILRASGEAQPAHNPLRAIQPGKHNLRQLVNAVQNQRDALEESFVAGRSKRKDAAGRYGW